MENSKKIRLPKQIVYLVFLICLFPSVLNFFGITFESKKTALDISLISAPPFQDHLFNLLSGAFLHSLLEWTAFMTAIFTVLFAYVNFYIQREVATLVIGLALFFAGCMDAFHTLAADRLIEAVAENKNLIPFTWAICRIFNACIMIFGVGIFLYKGVQIRAKIPFISCISVLFGLIAYVIIYLCATSNELPQTMFPEAFITRPFDFVPLLLFLFAGLYIYPRFYKKKPSVFAHALIISAIPEVFVQLHMTFGSTSLYDNHFNIAHFLKIWAYLVPFSGLALDYVHTYKKLNEEISFRKQAEKQLGEHQKSLESTIEKRTKELNEKSHLLSSVLENMGEGVCVVDTTFKFLVVNSMAEKISGQSYKEITDKNQWQEAFGMFYPDEVTPYETEKIPLFRAVQGDIVKDAEIFLRNPAKPNGVYISITATPLRNENDEIIGGIAAFRDMTEKKHYERELQRSNAELEQFAYIASHDLKEPLRMVSSFCLVLKEDYAEKLDANANEYIDFAVDGSKRLQRLITDLLNYSRVGRTNLNFTSCNCEKIVTSVLLLLSERIHEKAAKITNGPLPTLIADESLLTQLFLNLIGNGMKYQAENTVPEIHVSVQEKSAEYLFAVKDNGIGIDPKYHQKIFQIFQRLHSKESYSGTGIGLAICKKIIRAHRGDIWLESETGKGATFYFTLAKTLEANI